MVRWLLVIAPTFLHRVEYLEGFCSNVDFFGLTSRLWESAGFVDYLVSLTVLESCLLVMNF